MSVAAIAASLAFVVGAPGATAKDPPKPKLPAAAPGPAPIASQVVVRGQASLADAMRLVLSRARLGPTAGVAIVVDPTTALQSASAKIATALASLSAAPGRPTAWQAGPLGGTLSAAVSDPAALGPAVDAAFAQKSKPTLDTLGMLRRTIKKAAGAGGLVVYLAQARFEDALDLEGCIGELRAAKRSLSVIGPEAAFERPWGDVLAERYTTEHPDFQIPGVSRSPFGPEDPAAPWRSGDTAYPMMPYRFSDWESTFRPRSGAEAALSAHFARSKQKYHPPDPKKDPAAFYQWAREWVVPPDRETDPAGYQAWLDGLGSPPDYEKEKDAYFDWLARLETSAPQAPEKPEDALPGLDSLKGLADGLREHERAALPSGFGPHGLMRAVGMTGGAYVTWGWGSSDAAPTRYDFGRVNLFPPDLRSRGEIFADILHRPWALALLHAWNGLASDPALVRHTPPWVAGAPAAIGDKSAALLLGVYETPKERDEDVKEAKAVIGVLDKARTALEGEARSAGEPKDDVDRRLCADTDLLVHALETIRFHVGEYVLWAEALRKEAWKVKRTKSPYLNRECFLPGTEDDQPVVAEPVEVKDRAAADRLVASRTAFLEKYRGTPYGAMVAKNYVWTFKLDVLDMTPRGTLDEPKTGKGSSGGKGTPTTPPPPPSGGSTGTPGPTTGK